MATLFVPSAKLVLERALFSYIYNIYIYIQYTLSMLIIRVINHEKFKNAFN